MASIMASTMASPFDISAKACIERANKLLKQAGDEMTGNITGNIYQDIANGRLDPHEYKRFTWLMNKVVDSIECARDTSLPANVRDNLLTGAFWILSEAFDTRWRPRRRLWKENEDENEDELDLVDPLFMEWNQLMSDVEDLTVLSVG
jgi:hypothetical protein